MALPGSEIGSPERLVAYSIRHERSSGRPMPNQSVRCQSIWPVHVPLPAIPLRSVSVGASATSPAAMALRRGGPVDTSIRAKPRRGPATTGPNQLARSPFDRRRGPTWTKICTLIVCHSIRPTQAKAAIAGRLIWHGIPGSGARDVSRRHRDCCGTILDWPDGNPGYHAGGEADHSPTSLRAVDLRVRSRDYQQVLMADRLPNAQRQARRTAQRRSSDRGDDPARDRIPAEGRTDRCVAPAHSGAYGRRRPRYRGHLAQPR